MQSPELRTKFKFVVIDSPPIMAATDRGDPVCPGRWCAPVVRSGETPKEAFTRTRDLPDQRQEPPPRGGAQRRRLPAPRIITTSYRYYPYSYGYGPQEALELGHEEAPEHFPPSPGPGRFGQTLGGVVRYLITGGAVSSVQHLAERLLEKGEQVALLDNLSTGSMEISATLKGSDRLEYHLEGIENRQILAELVDDADVIVHPWRPRVGVKLIVERSGSHD